MYATLRRVKVHPGTATEIARRIEASFVPMIRQLNGFAAFSMLDLGETMATFTLFAEREQAEQANQQAATWVKANLEGLVAGSLEMSVGEVVVYATEAAQ